MSLGEFSILALGDAVWSPCHGQAVGCSAAGQEGFGRCRSLGAPPALPPSCLLLSLMHTFPFWTICMTQLGMSRKMNAIILIQ